MENPAERRQYTRLQLRAYGIGTVCIVMLGQERCHLDLVDISMGGARLKLQAPLPDTADNRLTLSVHDVKDGGRLQNLAAGIRWRVGLEIGVKFDAQLDFPLAELQSIIS